MLPRWRVTRNRYTRSAYEWLKRRGVTATRMYEYVAAPGDVPTDPAVDVEVGEPGAARALPGVEGVSGERSLWVRRDGRAVGRVLVSVDATHRIDPLETTLPVEGAYVRRLYVAPAARDEGLGTDLVAAALDYAEQSGASRATALVAADNTPSRWVFENNGFRPERVHQYVRLGPFRHRRTTDRSD